MKKIQNIVILIMTVVSGVAQNEQDALRYSRLGVNGSSRFNAMGGAFGALGADITCASYNPAGLGLFRKGEISYSANMRIKNNKVNAYNSSLSNSEAYLNFNNFGLAAAWKMAADPESRGVFAFSSTQLINFNNSLNFQGYTNNSSIAKDMLNLAQEKGSPNYLNSSYEGLAFNTFLIDTVNGKFFTYLDTKRSVKQTRDIVTKGKLNDINFSLAYSHKDDWYIGASLGIPVVSYTSTTTHTETDDRDSMRVTITSAPDKPLTYTTTYVDGLPAIYTSWLGFSNLAYTEYFRTNGTGINLKLGAIYRANDFLRLGFYYHTATYYNLTDVYYNSMSVTFDKDKTHPIKDTVPANKGYYKYKLITPSRLSISAAYIYKKLAVVSIDYENVQYSSASLQSSNASDFVSANNAIKTKYTMAHNIRMGAELNVKPVMLRLGYNMQGSPFGGVFTGQYVRNTFSVGMGFRSEKNFFMDVTWFRTLTNESYNMYTTLDTKAGISSNNTSLAATIGFKFK